MCMMMHTVCPSYSSSSSTEILPDDNGFQKHSRISARLTGGLCIEINSVMCLATVIKQVNEKALIKIGYGR